MTSGQGVAPAAAPTRRAFVALGSNLGDRWAHLRTGLALLPGTVAVSPVYETEPVGGPPGQGPYLNLVAELSTSLGPDALLAVARRAEAAAGRERGPRWGPRTLDVDILVVGDLVVRTPELEIPHPRMWQRGFVLVPLADLAPELVGERLSPAMRSGVVLAGVLPVEADR
jgi:2-amino-4-hydroxy-6-hydroxymethyldihydropteridine diphosphokinase